MNRHQEPKMNVGTMVYESDARLTVIRDQAGRNQREPAPAAPPPGDEKPPPPSYTFEHVREKGIFRLNWSSGEVDVFRDKPTRYLVVEPDPETGDMRPVTKHGRPAYLYLCREDREIR